MDAPPQPLTIRGIRVRAVDVPLDRPVETAAGPVKTAPLVLIDLATHQGVTGSSYVFSYTPAALGPLSALVAGLAPWLEGEPLAPTEIHRKLQQRFRLLGAQGLAGIAVSGIDMAAWDALARTCGMPLVSLLGGRPVPVPAYGSLSSMRPEAAAAEALEAVQRGFAAVKVKIGHPSVSEDLRVIDSIRLATREDIAVMVDYNQCLSVAEAIERCRVLDHQGICWIEEPTRADDYAGHAAIARDIATPVQAGENWWGPYDFAKAISLGATDLLMPDAMKVGGVTGWLRTAALADAHGMRLSSHLFPEFSVHLLAASPTCHWMESFDLAGPVLQQPVSYERGHALVPDRPGAGIEWDESAVTRYIVD